MVCGGELRYLRDTDQNRGQASSWGAELRQPSHLVNAYTALRVCPRGFTIGHRVLLYYHWTVLTNTFKVLCLLVPARAASASSRKWAFDKNNRTGGFSSSSQRKDGGGGDSGPVHCRANWAEQERRHPAEVLFYFCCGLCLPPRLTAEAPELESETLLLPPSLIQQGGPRGD